MRLIIYPYKMSSQSAKFIAENFERAKRVRENGNYKPHRNHVILNWGNPRRPIWYNRRIQVQHGHLINSFEAITVAQDKLLSFKCFDEDKVSIPPWTANKEIAEGWQEDRKKVVARTLLKGSGGRGIMLLNPDDELPPCPLYTQYIPKKDEYRIHVFNDKVIHQQQKRRELGFEGRNNQIRNWDNGWVYCTKEVNPPEMVINQALAAVKSLGLDFGAVDIIWNQRRQQAYVLEVNTAPGLEGSTITAYVKAIKERYDV